MTTKHWTTHNIKQVLDENYNRGVNGKDYEDIVPDLEATLWSREDRAMDLATKDRDIYNPSINREDFLTRVAIVLDEHLFKPSGYQVPRKTR